MSFEFNDFQPLSGFMPRDVVIKLGTHHHRNLDRAKLERGLRDEILNVKTLEISFSSDYETTVAVNKRSDSKAALEIVCTVNDVAYALSLD